MKLKATKQGNFNFKYSHFTKLSILAVLLLSISLASCNKKTTYPYSTYETRIITSMMNETYVVRAEGKGATKTIAKRQAEKKAVHDLIFKNLYGEQAMLQALVQDPRIEQTRADYFNYFFSDKGLYTKFIIDIKERQEKYDTDVIDVCIINVCVDRAALKQQLMEDGIR